MVMIAVLALVGSAASAIVVPGFVLELSAQENMTGSMTGNMTGNMTDMVARLQPNLERSLHFYHHRINFD